MPRLVGMLKNGQIIYVGEHGQQLASMASVGELSQGLVLSEADATVWPRVSHQSRAACQRCLLEAMLENR